MRKYVVTILFCVLLAASAALVLMPADAESIESENRTAAEMPELTRESVTSGEFMSGFDEYINDNIGFRGALMDASSVIRSYFGYTPKLVGRIISTTSDIGTEETLDGSLAVVDGKIMEMFSKKPAVEERYAEALNNIRAALPENIEMYSMLVPTQLEFEEPIYANAQDSQKSCIDDIGSMLSGDIITVDAYGALKDAAKTSSNLYFKTDHHWTMDGAYYGYAAFMEASGGETARKAEFVKKEYQSFFGTLYQKAGIRMSRSAMDTLYYYDTADGKDIGIVMKEFADGELREYGWQSKIFDDTKDGYLFFMGGDNPIEEIENNSVEEGETLIIIKDSYANAAVPWLINNYKKIILIDPRYYDGDIAAAAEEYNADELLVLNYVFTTTFYDYCDMLNDLVK